MKKLFLTLLTAVSFTSFGQYIPTEGSFSTTYTQLRSFEKQDSLWNYSGGDFKEWTFIFNVNCFTYLGGPEMFGAIMEDGEGEPKFMYNYLGDLYESEDEFGKYGAYQVDILSKEDNGTWKWWNVGELRYYGSWTILYLGNPTFMKFSYFNVKD
jgi:hypothetical protein